MGAKRTVGYMFRGFVRRGKVLQIPKQMRTANLEIYDPYDERRYSTPRQESSFLVQEGAFTSFTRAGTYKCRQLQNGGRIITHKLQQKCGFLQSWTVAKVQKPY